MGKCIPRSLFFENSTDAERLYNHSGVFQSYMSPGISLEPDTATHSGIKQLDLLYPEGQWQGRQRNRNKGV